MKFLQALQSAVLFCGIATATPVSQPDDVEAEAFEVGYCKKASQPLEK